MPAKGRGRGRGRKATKAKEAVNPSKILSYPPEALSDEEMEDKTQMIMDGQSRDATHNNEKRETAQLNIEEDISKLEAPTFTTIDRGPPEPVHRDTKLRWDYKVNLIGEKVLNPLLHCCEKCLHPILIYGRMIPCRHVFCLDCGKAAKNSCPRCNEKVSRVEQSALGTVFMCMYGGSRYGYNGCCRTYLSHRDLQAHINHRHLKPPKSTSSSKHKPSLNQELPNNPPLAKSSLSTPTRDPLLQIVSQSTKSMQRLLDKHYEQASNVPKPAAPAENAQPPTSQSFSAPRPIARAQTNLITVPIQVHSAQSSIPPTGISSGEYASYSAVPENSLSQAAPSAIPNYHMQVNQPYLQPTQQHMTAPVSYPTIHPTAPISSSQASSFGQSPPAHSTHHMPPPAAVPNPVPAQQVYVTPLPSVQRPGLNIQPTRPPVTLPQRFSAPQFEEVHRSSPSYHWQRARPPQRGVPPPPPQTSTYQSQFYR